MNTSEPGKDNQEHGVLGEPSEALPSVSERSTKAEITKAYRELIKKYEENVRKRRAVEVRKTTDEQTVKRAGEYTVDAILDQMDGIKRSMEAGLADLSRALVRERRRLEEVGQAVTAQERRLKELNDIEAAAVGLEELIAAQEAGKEEFEAELQGLRTARAREEEEYRFRIGQERKKEDAARLEREDALAKREAEIRAQENEISELRQKSEQFPTELEEALVKARQEAAEAVQKELQSKAEIAAKENEGERKVLAARIGFLEQMLARQTEEITSLKRDLDEATRHVQSIAEKAIESASGKQTLEAVSDIAMQQAGGSRFERKE